jgi:hypothetical protein
MSGRRLYCRSVVRTGPRSGELCSRIASSIVTAMFGYGTPVCGFHSKAYTKDGVARIAYWDPKNEGWR